MDINQIIAYLSTSILVLNFIVFFNCFSFFGRAVKIFTIYLGLILVIQISSLILWNFGINNIFLSHFYFIVQFIVLSIFYKEILIAKVQKKFILGSLLMILGFLTIQYLFFPNLFKKFNLVEIVATSVPLVMYSILHFYNILSSNRNFFYINTGILFYLSGSTLLFVAGNYIVSSNSILNKSIWIVNSSLFVVFQILIFIEWRKNYYKKTLRS